MKKLALIAAVILTTITLQSCRQADEVLSPEEAATLQRVQDSSNSSLNRNNGTINNNGDVIINNVENTSPTTEVDGEIVPPPKK